jgi:hypothetical protein
VIKCMVPVLAGFALFSLGACAQDGKQGPTDDEIRRLLVEQSISGYAGECPCPETRTASGKRCGKNSAYTRAGSDRPLCYPSNVSAALIKRYRDQLTKR